MSKKERDEIRGLIENFEVILNDEISSAEEKRVAEHQINKLSGMLLSPLLPAGIIRIVLMLGFLLLVFLRF